MHRCLAACLLLSFTVAAAPAQQPQPKRRVAVIDFDYATVLSGVAALFGTNQDVGKGIADLLVDQLVKDGIYSVIERKQIDKILAEQNFSNSDRADAATAAKVGKVLGVDAIVLGSITQFGRDDRKTDVGGRALGGVTGRFGVGGVQRTRSTAVVQITARMIDTSTAEILASVTSKNEASRDGTGIIGTGGSYAGMAGGVLDMRSANFGETVLGEATTKTVADLARQLDAKAGAIPVTVKEINGLVADADPSGTMIINVGSAAGVNVGDQLAIKRKIREVRDPATGKVLRVIDEAVGVITVTEVDQQSAVGKFTGPGTPQVGDTVSNSK
jgi:curli biogenesis system outer membrane secretion channel CsgG